MVGAQRGDTGGKAPQAKSGDTVQVHYTGRLNDGTVFDSSVERDPLQFTIGEDQVIQGFEQAVLGMSLGDSRTVEILVDDAYGPRDERLILVVDRAQLPEHIQPRVDDHLQVRRPDGGQLVVTVTEVSEQSVTMDGNHPLAGQDLTFDIELVAIE
jgi:peptidylprolyl isomerase